MRRMGIMGVMGVMGLILATIATQAAAPQGSAGGARMQPLERWQLVDECPQCDGVQTAAGANITTIDFECLDLGELDAPLSFSAGGVQVEIKAVGGKIAVVDHPGPLLGMRSLSTDVDVCLSDEDAYGYVLITFRSILPGGHFAGVEWVAAAMTSNEGHEDDPPAFYCCLDYGEGCDLGTPYKFGPGAFGQYASWPSNVVYRGGVSYGGYPAITSCIFSGGVFGSMSLATSLQ